MKLRLRQDQDTFRHIRQNGQRQRDRYRVSWRQSHSCPRSKKLTNRQRVQRTCKHDGRRARSLAKGRTIRVLRLVQVRRLRRDNRPRKVSLNRRHSITCSPISSHTRASLTPFSLSRSSGRKIIEILKKNPEKDPSKYDEDDVAHMRRVAAYCKRHLAQEEKAKQDTSSKSYKSLKNWGHDAQKT